MTFSSPFSYEKHAKIQKFIALDLVKIASSNTLKPNSKILDIGSGTGFIVKHFTNQDTYATDNSIEMYNFLKESGIKATLHNAASEFFPYQDNFFDIILSSMAAQWFWQDFLIKTVPEIKRLLKQDGKAFIAVPTNLSLKEISNSFTFSGLKNPIMQLPSYKHFSITKTYTEYGTIFEILKRMNLIGAKNPNFTQKITTEKARLIKKNFPNYTTWNIGFLEITKFDEPILESNS